jgi:hypothetical protein
MGIQNHAFSQKSYIFIHICLNFITLSVLWHDKFGAGMGVVGIVTSPPAGQPMNHGLTPGQGN